VDAGVRYWAFLSYSHDDREQAARLHRALEGYRIPRRLVGRAGPHGPVPPRLHPIFRDRDELTASVRIGALVEQALKASRALIVVCSRAAAVSPWVDAEIAAFQRLQPRMPVLCVLLDGAPMASRDAATRAHECLPPALRARFGKGAGIADAAPVAVDLRAEGDGWRLGIQKLVAGLAGVPLDQLVQRDAHRRHLRMAWLSAALAVIAASLGTMAVLAVGARNDAQRQRVQAEGLVEFMLGDLRRKLEPVGRLDALDAVGTRALQYYDSQSLRKLDADALGRRSRALHLIGEISDRRGDMQAARDAFHRASDTTAELLQRTPGDGQRVFDHSQSVYWVGYIDRQYGDNVSAEKAMREYQRLARRMHAIDPANEAWFAEIGYAHSNLGTLLREQGRTDEAIVQFEQARAVFARLVRSAPQDPARLLDLAQSYSWTSSSFADALRFADALQAREKEIAIYRSMLAREPRNALVAERLMFAEGFLAEIQISRGALKPAGEIIGAANRMAEAQLRLEPDNVDWQKAAAKARLLRAELLVLQDNAEAGLAELQRARALIAALLAHDAAGWEWRVELQERHAQLESDALRQLGRRAEATRVAAASVERLRAVMKDPEQQARSRRWLVTAAGRLARLQDETGNHAGSRANWELVKAGAREPSATDAESLAWLVQADMALGANDAADRLRARLEQAGYRHPAFAFLMMDSTRKATGGALR
jgi:tetratricopeptide (TPR) repeat protein